MENNLIQLDILFKDTIEVFYAKAKALTSEIWKDMYLAPICLYRINGPAFLYKHPDPPASFRKISDDLYIGTQKEAQLFGATIIKINNYLTAIVDYSFENRYSQEDEVYAELYHELHHAFQRREELSIKNDNPIEVMSYPENDINDGLKIFEQKLLYKMYSVTNEVEFKQLLNQFYSCRNKRELVIKNYIELEKHIENYEGSAFYCEMQFYKRFSDEDNSLKELYIKKHFFSPLITPYFGRNNLRIRHLASGMTLCLILDKYFKNWQIEFYNNSINLYDYFISKFSVKTVELPEITNINSFSNYYTKKEKEKHLTNISKFNSQNGIKVILKFKSTPQFESFDPMNGENIDNSRILHKSMLKLSQKENNLFIIDKEVVSIYLSDFWSINEIILFESENNISVSENFIKINNPNVKISWKGILLNKEKKEIIFECV